MWARDVGFLFFVLEHLGGVGAFVIQGAFNTIDLIIVTLKL